MAMAPFRGKSQRGHQPLAEARGDSGHFAAAGRGGMPGEMETVTAEVQLAPPVLSDHSWGGGFP